MDRTNRGVTGGVEVNGLRASRGRDHGVDLTSPGRDHGVDLASPGRDHGVDLVNQAKADQESRARAHPVAGVDGDLVSRS